MSRHLATLVRRRPGLVVLSALYTAIAVLVARSPMTVALCTALFLSVAVQFALVARGIRAGRVAEAGGAS